MARIIRRAEWGARYGDGRYVTSLPARGAFLHHSVTIAPDLKAPFDDDYEAIRTIERIGRDRFGEVYGFPYTWGITPVGLIFEGHHVGKTGAHTRGHNTDYRAIVLVGNYERDEPTRAQIESAAWLLREAHGRGWLAKPEIVGPHSSVSATTCPGRYGRAVIPEINSLAAQPLRRYSMLVYTRHGTPDGAAASFANDNIQAIPGVFTTNVSEARSARERGEKVVAVGGPAARDVPNAQVKIVGANRADTAKAVIDFAARGWR